MGEQSRVNVGCLKLEVVGKINSSDEAVILELLRAHNISNFGQSGRSDLAIILRDGGNTIGGLVGYTSRRMLYVSLLFVPAEMRNQGLAGRMLEMAEQEAISRNCIGAYLDTMSCDAENFYRKRGYEVFGRLDGFEDALTVAWMKKRLR
ncbi:GNAT family N-acetyltransferase (plasmid) [Shinella sumterensis]|nr:GNAT family N-acetyltransferase [Shinella sumterensis]